MIFIVSICYAILISAYLLVRGWRHGFVHPAILFVAAQSVMFFGTLPLLSEYREADRVHAASMFGGILSFTLGTLCIQLASRSPARLRRWQASSLEHVEDDFAFNFLISSIFLVGMLVCVVYYHSVGYVFVLEAARAMVFGGMSAGEASSARLAAYAGDEYFAPGYVNQFKDVLLPVIWAFLVVRALLAKKYWQLVCCVLLTPLLLLFIVGTGQRGALVQATLMIFVIAQLSLPPVLRRRFLLTVGIGSLAAFLMVSALNGRSTSSIGSLSDVGTLLIETRDRVITINQRASVAGFRYLYSRDVQWGREWLTDITSLLPGKSFVPATTSREIHAQLHGGSMRGTAPPSVWGSLWYNFHAFGIVIGGLFLGLGYELVYRSMVTGPKTLFRLCVYGGLSVILGTWVAGSILSLPDRGAVTLVILGVLAVIAKSAARERSLHRRVISQ